MLVQLGWLDGFVMAVDGGDAKQTQQPTAESNRGGIEQVCVARGRGKGCKNTTTNQKRGVDVDAQPCCYVAIYISLKLNGS